MKIDRNLNLVIPILDENEKIKHYVHVMPISTEVFEKHFVLLSRACSEIVAGGVAASRVSYLYLKKTAEDLGEWESVKVTLIAEMKRLSSVLVGSSEGYEVLPWHTAIERKIIDPEEVREVENAVAFFIVNWRIAKMTDLPNIVNILIGLGAQSTTSLNATAFAASLKTSTDPAPTPLKVTPSSIPF